MKQSRYNEWLSTLCTRERTSEGMHGREEGKRRESGHSRKTEEDECGKSWREEVRDTQREREGERESESERWRVVGKLKLFPDSEWKHFVAAPAAAALLLEFLRFPLPRHIPLVAEHDGTL